MRADISKHIMQKKGRPVMQVFVITKYRWRYLRLEFAQLLMGECKSDREEPEENACVTLPYLRTKLARVHVDVSLFVCTKNCGVALRA